MMEISEPQTSITATVRHARAKLKSSLISRRHCRMPPRGRSIVCRKIVPQRRKSSEADRARIDHEALAGHAIALRRGEKYQPAGDILGPNVNLHHPWSEYPRLVRGIPFHFEFGHGIADHAVGEGVDADSVRRQFASERPGHRH